MLEKSRMEPKVQWRRGAGALALAFAMAWGNGAFAASGYSGMSVDGKRVEPKGAAPAPSKKDSVERKESMRKSEATDKIEIKAGSATEDRSNGKVNTNADNDGKTGTDGGKVAKADKGGNKFLKAIVWYVPNRALDVVDAVRLSVTAGPTAGVNVRATQWATAGAMEFDGTRVGLDGRGEDVASSLVKEDQISECGAKLLMLHVGDADRPHWEVGADAHALVGLRLGVDFSHVVDAVTGIVLWDREGDDRGWSWNPF